MAERTRSNAHAVAHGLIRVSPGVICYFRKKEWQCFERLNRQRGEIVSDQELIAAIWPRQVPKGDELQLHELRVLIHQLRRTLAGRFAVVRQRKCRRLGNYPGGYRLVSTRGARGKALPAGNGVAV